MPKKQWRDEDMVQALEKVSAGMTVRHAARLFNVPRNTLGDRVSGRVTHGCRTGPKQLLAPEDERALVQYYLYCAQHGFPLIKARLMAYANSVRRKRSPNEDVPPLGKKWWHCFRKRHAAELSMMTPDTTDRGRAASARQSIVGQYFDLLTSTLEKYGLKNKSTQIYNCNETRFKMDGTKFKELSPQGEKHVYQQAPGTQDHVSVLACFNAAGEDIPPFIIFAKHFPGGPYTQGGPPNALYGKSKAGYIDGDLFKRWFKHFIRHAPKERPLLLIFDGHKSHLALEVTEAAKREAVVLLCLPPQCSHVLQPLDVGFFGPLKAEFAKVAGNLCHLKNSYFVNKTKFAKVFRHPYQQLKDRGIVVEGFRRCGIFPLNPYAVDSSHLMPSSGPRSSSTSSPQEPAASSASAQVTASESHLLAFPSTQSHNLHFSAPLDHPLVAAGLIQPDLADVLTWADNRKKTIRHVPVKARDITGEEYERLLWQEDSARVAEDAKEQRAQRKRARTTKDPIAGAENTCSDPAMASGTTPSCTSSASTPSTSVGASSSSSSSSLHLAAETRGEKRKAPRKSRQLDEGGDRDAPIAHSQDLCGRCRHLNPPGNDSTIVSWVSCALCEEWFHCSCEQWKHSEKEEFECLRCRKIRARIMSSLKF